MRGLLLLITALFAVIVGLVFDWRYVVAPLLLYAVMRWAIASLRVLANDAKQLADPDGPSAVAENERTFFWCEECETEVLLLVRGSSRAPSHCGQRMHERTELLD